ncbi:MAG: MFS transporter [Butyricicoccus pullicaecorum]|nr:MFS transporter [Butyricicoccus pullicaecorum]
MGAKKTDYQKTVRACYLGTITQSVVLNVTPILFLPLAACYGLSFEQLGRLVLVNFVCQFVSDLAFARPVERWGIRPFVVGGHACTALGLILFSAAPLLFPNHIYFGLLLATALFSSGGGLLELLLNPIMSALPGDDTARRLSLMHSCYGWGHIAVALISTLLIFALGRERWFVVPLLWSLLPLVNCLNFARAPLVQMIEEQQRTRLGTLLRRPFFVLCLGAMFFNGAIEVTMSQWASSFLEQSIGLPKVMGDTLGVCMYAAMMAVGRLLYAKFGQQVDVFRLMLWGAVLCGGCYLVAGLSGLPVFCLLACAACGFGVSIMWPACVAIAADTYPLAGASMFALVSGFGDAGSAIGPWGVGMIADTASNGLQTGLAAASVFAIGMWICTYYLRAHYRAERQVTIGE